MGVKISSHTGNSLNCSMSWAVKPVVPWWLVVSGAGRGRCLSWWMLFWLPWWHRDCYPLSGGAWADCVLGHAAGLPVLLSCRLSLAVVWSHRVIFHEYAEKFNVRRELSELLEKRFGARRNFVHHKLFRVLLEQRQGCSLNVHNQ